MQQRKVPAPVGVIFDLDGTLLDTLADIAGVMNSVVERLGYPGAPVKEYRERVGWGLAELTRRSLPPEAANEQALIQQIIREFKELHEANPVTHTVPFPGIPELIRELRDRGTALFIHTNKPAGITAKVVETLLSREALGLESEPFTGVAGQQDDLPRKPDPAGVHLLLKGTGIAPEDVYYIGDSEVDVETARAAGCTAIAVTWGFRPVEILTEARPDKICYSMEQLRLALGLPQLQGERQ